MKPQTTSSAASTKPAMTWKACGPTICNSPRSSPGKIHSTANTIVVTASQRHSRMRASPKARGGDDGEIDIERPIVRLAAGDQDGRREGADHAKACKRGPMQKRGGERAERDEPSSTKAVAGTRKP